MDELIGQLAAQAGIDSAVAEKTVGIILGFLRDEGPSDKVQALIDAIPGAETAITASSNGGGFARLMGGGLMALGTKLTGLGLGMGEIQSVARELFRFGRDNLLRISQLLLHCCNTRCAIEGSNAVIACNSLPRRSR